MKKIIAVVYETESENKNLWQERFLFIKKENEVLQENNKLLKFENILLNDRLNELKTSQTNEQTSYADILKSDKKEASSNYKTLVIKSKKNYNEDQLNETIKSNINPAKDDINATLVKKKGFVKLIYENTNEDDKLKNLLTQKLVNEVTVEEEKLKNPKIKIGNITEK